VKYSCVVSIWREFYKFQANLAFLYQIACINVFKKLILGQI